MKNLFLLLSTTTLFSLNWLSADNTEKQQNEWEEEQAICEETPKKVYKFKMQTEFYGQMQPWQKEQFAEEQYEESSWPSRREELSDFLSR